MLIHGVVFSLQNVKNHYASLDAQTCNFGRQLAFKEDSISLDIPEEIQDGWRVVSALPPNVSRLLST